LFWNVIFQAPVPQEWKLVGALHGTALLR